MKRTYKKSIILLFSVVLELFFYSCHNPFLADETKMYTVSFVTNCDTKIDSYRTNRIESIQKLTKENYEFGGWYISENFNGEPITFPYEVTQDITLYAKWNEIYTVSFVTDCDIEIDSYRTNKIDSIQDLSKEGHVLDGWYTNENFNGEPITFPYKVTCEITLYAKWIDENNIAYITPSSLKESNKNYAYSDGVLTITSEAAMAVFNGNLNDLSIKLNKVNTKLVFDNFTLSSSKTSPLIESSFDISIEYKGTNNLSSSSSTTDCLIKSSGTIEIKGDENSSLLLKPNATTTSTDCATIKANKVIINGGVIKIKASDGADYSTDDFGEKTGRNGASGIDASKTVVKNNAKVTIQAGNGGKGTQGKTGNPNPGSQPAQNDVPGSTGKSGGRGGDGVSGGTGGNGGDAVKGNFFVESGKIVLSGGKGGTGGKGGSGGKGGKGCYVTAWWSTGGTGGSGGDGGLGGIGGNGGNAVKGNFSAESGEIELSGGNGGTGGEGGSGGNGGDGGNYQDSSTAGTGGRGGNGGKGGAGGNGGDAVTGSFERNNAYVSLSGGESGSGGNTGNSGNNGSSGVYQKKK